MSSVIQASPTHVFIKGACDRQVVSVNESMHFIEETRDWTEMRLYLKEGTCKTLFKTILDEICTSPYSVSLTL